MITSGTWTESGSKFSRSTVDWGAQMDWLNRQIDRGQKKQNDVLSGVKRTESLGTSEHFKKRLRILFLEIDQDQSGEIDLQELRAGLKHLEIGISEIQIGLLFEAMDTNRSGFIDFRKFSELMTNILSGRTQTGKDGFSHVLANHLG